MCVVSPASVKPLMGLQWWSQQPATATTTTAAAEADTASAAGGFMVDNLPNIHILTHNINIEHQQKPHTKPHTKLWYKDLQQDTTEGCVNHG